VSPSIAKYDACSSNHEVCCKLQKGAPRVSTRRFGASSNSKLTKTEEGSEMGD